MVYKLEFSEHAVEDLDALGVSERARIIKKLAWFVTQPDPLVFARCLRVVECGQYRFRVGDYRVIFDAKKNYIRVLRVGHRREIYR